MPQIPPANLFLLPQQIKGSEVRGGGGGGGGGGAAGLLGSLANVRWHQIHKEKTHWSLAEVKVSMWRPFRLCECSPRQKSKMITRLFVLFKANWLYFKPVYPVWRISVR